MLLPRNLISGHRGAAVPRWRRHAQQVLDEEIESLVVAVRRGRIVAAAGGVIGAWHHQEIEVLVGG